MIWPPQNGGARVVYVTTTMQFKNNQVERRQCTVCVVHGTVFGHGLIAMQLLVNDDGLPLHSGESIWFRVEERSATVYTLLPSTSLQFFSQPPGILVRYCRPCTAFATATILGQYNYQCYQSTGIVAQHTGQCQTTAKAQSTTTTSYVCLQHSVAKCQILVRSNNYHSTIPNYLSRQQ